MRGKGSQKEARLERLKEEIVEYIAIRADCSATDMKYYLSNERRMRNHGLTTRRSDYLSQDTYLTLWDSSWITPQEKDSTGSLPKRQIHLFQPPRAIMEWPSHAVYYLAISSLENDESSIIPTFQITNLYGHYYQINLHQLSNNKSPHCAHLKSAYSS